MHDGAVTVLLRCAAGAARKTHMAWNWVELQQLLVASPCVRLVLSGHDHMGGYAQHGHVHFVTVEAMLEGELGSAVPGSDCVVALYQHGKFHNYIATAGQCCPGRPFCNPVASAVQGRHNGSLAQMSADAMQMHL